MDRLSFYEFAGIVVPGTLLLFGLFVLAPEVRATFTDQGFGIGELGLFLIIAYGTGHLVAAVGNLLEKLWWKPWGGMPTDWLVQRGQRIISVHQVTRLEELVRAKLKLSLPGVTGLDPRQWWPVSRQIYAAVVAAGRSSRIDVFNGNYGLARGMASAGFLLTTASVVIDLTNWRAHLALAVATVLALFRMHRVAVQYAREVMVQFVQLGAE